MHIKNWKNSEWLQDSLQKSLRAVSFSLEEKRFGGKMEGWSTTRGRHYSPKVHHIVNKYVNSSAAYPVYCREHLIFFILFKTRSLYEKLNIMQC
jgi:hypothetical protein